MVYVYNIAGGSGSQAPGGAGAARPRSARAAAAALAGAAPAPPPDALQLRRALASKLKTEVVDIANWYGTLTLTTDTPSLFQINITISDVLEFNFYTFGWCVWKKQHRFVIITLYLYCLLN